MGKRRKELKLYYISALLYLIMVFAGAWRVFATLRAFFPTLTVLAYVSICASLCAALPLGTVLPRSKAAKILSIIGNYLVCFQITFFFAAVIEWAVKLAVVNILSLLTASQYARVSALLFVFTALITIYGAVHARRVRLTRYTCRLEKPSSLNRTLRIVHLSDLHLGSVNDLHAIRDIVRRVNTLSPDLVCVTGDTFTENIRDVFELEEIAEAFRSLVSKHGVYACLGNHDSGPEFSHMAAFFQSAGIRVLSDEYVKFDGITLLGRSDMTPGGDIKHRRKPINLCLAGADAANIIIVLDHQPGDMENANAAGVDLVLSGHTHGGQFFPVHRMVRRVFPHYFGCKRYGSMYSVVSSGTCAAIPPIRIGSHSEIVEITVTQTGKGRLMETGIRA